MIATDVPEWRIVTDEIWFAVQERFTKRNGEQPVKRSHSAAKYALSGIASVAARSSPIACARLEVARIA